MVADSNAAGGNRLTAMVSAIWRNAVVVVAVGQLVSPILVFRSSADALTSESSATTITPPGWAFAMWGVICAACFVYAIYQRPTRQSHPLSALVDRLAPPLTVVFSLFSVWLALARVEWVWGTVPVFAAMLVGLLRAGQIAAVSPALARVGTGPRLLISVLLGTYAGWTPIALFVNVSAAVRQSGAPIDSVIGVTWQAVLLVCAVAVAATVTVKWGASLPYVLTVVWALVGAAASSYLNQSPTLTAV